MSPTQKGSDCNLFRVVTVYLFLMLQRITSMQPKLRATRLQICKVSGVDVETRE